MLRLRAERGRRVCGDPALYPRVTDVRYRYEPERCVAVAVRRRSARRPRTGPDASRKRTRRANLKALADELRAEAVATPISTSSMTATVLAGAYAAKNLSRAVGTMRLTQGDPGELKRAMLGYDAAFRGGLLRRPENAGVAAELHAHLAGLLVVLNKHVDAS